MPRRILSAVTTLAAIGALALAAQPASAAVSPAAGITAMTIDGHPQHLLPGPIERTSGLDVTSTRRLISVSDGISASVALEMPTSSPIFMLGSYPATRWGSPTDTQGSMWVAGRLGAGCNQPEGSFSVYEVEFADGGNGDLTRFAASYRFTCEPGGDPVVGEVRWNSTLDYLRFGLVPIGRDARQTLTVTAPEAQTLGTAEILGQDSAAYRIVADSCSDRGLAAGETCAVTVQAYPVQRDPSRAMLHVPVLGFGGFAHRASITLVGEETYDGLYTGLPAKRLLDTRRKTGVTTTTPIGAGKSIDVTVTGRGGVPSGGVSAVVLNLTAVAPTSRGYLTVYPSTAARPTASSINFNRGWTGANLVTVPITGSGKVRIYNASGSTHAVADVVGYYNSTTSAPDPAVTPLGGYESVGPVRLVDTRTAAWGRQPLLAQEYLWRSVDWDPAFNNRVQAFALNVTVVAPTRAGYVTVFSGDGPDQIPATSSINFTAGRTVPNMVVVKAGQCYAECSSPSSVIPRFGVVNGSSGTVHVVVDIVGVYFRPTADDQGWRFRALPAPTRFVDSRKGQGLTSNLGSNATRTVLAPGTVAGYNTMALVTNTTAAQPTSTTVLTLWPNDGSARPGVSNLNPYAGQIVSNMTITEVWTQNDFRVHNSTGTTPLVMDAAGSFELSPPVGPPGAATARTARGTLAADSAPKGESSVPLPGGTGTHAVVRR